MIRATRASPNRSFRRNKTDSAAKASMRGKALRISRSVILLACFCASLVPAKGQIAPRNQRTPAAPPTELKDISGMWMLLYDGANVPRATLSPDVTQADLIVHAKMDAAAMRWCNYVGTPFLMQSRFPLEIQQGKTETIIVAAEVSVARHIYTDGRTHVDPSIFEPTSNGDSIGHWEGETFVVDTIGFASDRGITSIPGGGFRTATSHLVERFKLVEGGSKLLVKFTWEDPMVYAKPHTYAFMYTPAPKGLWSRKVACDPFDDQRTNFLIQAPQ